MRKTVLSEIAANKIHDLFSYKDGALYWREKGWGRDNIFTPAGYKRPDNRWLIGIKGRYYFRSRLVWAWWNKRWPKLQIDHINRVRYDDNINNLRDVSGAINTLNTCAANCRYNKLASKWEAYYDSKGKHHYLGLYNSFEEGRKIGRAAKTRAIVRELKEVL